MSKSNHRVLAVGLAIAFAFSILFAVRPPHWHITWIAVGTAILFSYFVFIAEKVG